MEQNVDLQKLTPPHPLESFFVREGELDRLGRPMSEGAERYRAGWGLFGMTGRWADTALAADSVEAMQFCIDHGIVTRDSKTLYNTTLRTLAKDRGHERVAALLASLGWPA